jgi:hypothetical protein
VADGAGSLAAGRAHRLHHLPFLPQSAVATGPGAEATWHLGKGTVPDLPRGKASDSTNGLPQLPHCPMMFSVLQFGHVCLLVSMSEFCASVPGQADEAEGVRLRSRTVSLSLNRWLLFPVLKSHDR